MKSMVCEKGNSPTVAEHSLEQSKYPYGLKLNIDEQVYRKLEFKEVPQIGQKFMIMALAEVCSVYSEKSMDGQDRISISLQITDMEAKKSEKQKSPEKALYGDDDSAGDED